MAAGFELAFSLGPRTKLSRFRESWDEFAPPEAYSLEDFTSPELVRIPRTTRDLGRLKETRQPCRSASVG